MKIQELFTQFLFLRHFETFNKFLSTLRTQPCGLKSEMEHII